jgi:hypothetical protein
MALDEPKTTDKVFDIGGFTYLVNSDFLEKIQPVKVDFQDIGFRLSCNTEFQASGCSGCGTESTCH